MFGCASTGEDEDSGNNDRNITNGNSAPVAEAGADRGATTSIPVTLDGSLSFDADGDLLDFSWSFTSIPAGSSATLVDPSSVIASFVPDVDGTFELSLMVDDGRDTDSDTLTVVASATGPFDCVESEVICVDDTAGETQEFADIQSAVDTAGPGDVVLVHPGDYAGFRVSSGSSGTSGQPLTITAFYGAVNLTSSEAFTDNMIRVQNADHVTIQGFAMDRSGFVASYDYDEACIAARGASASSPMVGLKFLDNTLVGCAPAGMYLSNVADLQVIGNDIRESRAVGGSSNGGLGIYLSNAGTDDAIVRNNVILDNENEGLHMNGDAGVGGDGLQTGHLIERNVIAGNITNGISLDGVQAITLVNNVIMNNGRHGFRGYVGDGAAGPRNWVVINNTFYNNGDPSNGGSAGKTSDDHGGHVILNNLVVDNEFNDFDINVANFAEIDNLYRSDESELFVDAPNGDLRLKAAAAAVNEGATSFMSQNAPAIDLSTGARDAQPDVGAFELGSDLPSWYP